MRVSGLASQECPTTSRAETDDDKDDEEIDGDDDDEEEATEDEDEDLERLQEMRGMMEKKMRREGETMKEIRAPLEGTHKGSSKTKDCQRQQRLQELLQTLTA